MIIKNAENVFNTVPPNFCIFNVCIIPIPTQDADYFETQATQIVFIVPHCKFFADVSLGKCVLGVSSGAGKRRAGRGHSCVPANKNYTQWTWANSTRSLVPWVMRFVCAVRLVLKKRWTRSRISRWPKYIESLLHCCCGCDGVGDIIKLPCRTVSCVCLQMCRS